jgi:hypothetical protein
MMNDSTVSDTDRAVLMLARAMYVHYCGEKSFDPYSAPWVPRWASDYARIAVEAYGFDDEGVQELSHELTAA